MDCPRTAPKTSQADDEPGPSGAAQRAIADRGSGPYGHGIRCGTNLIRWGGGVPTLRFVSPERHWRAASLVLLAAFLAWRAARYAGPDHAAVLVVAGLAAAMLLGFVIPVMRSCLLVTEAGLTDRRAIRTVALAWPQIAGFQVTRPGGLWGGFCIVADCRDGTHVHLLSVRAYSRAPSSSHLDDLTRMCWTLEDRLGPRDGQPPARG